MSDLRALPHSNQNSGGSGEAPAPDTMAPPSSDEGRDRPAAPTGSNVTGSSSGRWGMGQLGLRKRSANRENLTLSADGSTQVADLAGMGAWSDEPFKEWEAMSM